ncbi:MAG: TIGR03435 family protein [Terracidiphilus sp.]
MALLACLALPASAAAQATAAAPAFDVASVKASRQMLGPDYNNQLSYSPIGITARNATLKRLVAEAYRVQLDQVAGPGWLDRDEYDIDARAAEGATRGQMAAMLRSLLAERFSLAEHSESRQMRVYALVAGKSGPRIQPMKDGEAAKAQPGFHFHGDLHQLADLLTVQLSIPAPENPREPVRAGGPQIPVLDETGLAGIFDFSVDIHPELGTDMFTVWQRALKDQLGLSIESRKEIVPMVVVDQAAKIPTEN